jgi:hypothetical protein
MEVLGWKGELSGAGQGECVVLGGCVSTSIWGSGCVGWGESSGWIWEGSVCVHGRGVEWGACLGWV